MDLSDLPGKSDTGRLGREDNESTKPHISRQLLVAFRNQGVGGAAGAGYGGQNLDSQANAFLSMSSYIPSPPSEYLFSTYCVPNAFLTREPRLLKRYALLLVVTLVALAFPFMWIVIIFWRKI